MNPRAGARWRHERIQAMAAALSGGGYEVRMTTDLAELAGLSAESWNAGDLRAVVAVGGDGTASVVRNRVPLEVPLLPVPTGTENLLGRYTGQTAEPAAVLRTIEEGVTIGLDLGRANGKYFLLMISAGFDAEVVRSLHENRRGNIKRTAYLLPALQTIRRYGFPEMQLYWTDGPTLSERPLCCRWLFGFNLPLYALGLPIAPDAVATDGLLDVCAFERGTTWSIVRYLWHVKRGGHRSLADTRVVRTRRFRLEAVNAPNVAYQLDGDHGGVLPVDVEVIPGELRLLVSPETAGRLGFAVER
jgi:diacylglycerol kinase family enzyme